MNMPYSCLANLGREVERPAEGTLSRTVHQKEQLKAVLAVGVAGLASGLLGLGCRRPLGEGRCLAFTEPLALFEGLAQLFDLELQVGNFLTQPQAFRTSYSHTGSLAADSSVSCASLPENGRHPMLRHRWALNNDLGPQC